MTKSSATTYSIAILSIMMTTVLLAPSHSIAADAPTDAVRSTINEVLRIVKDESLKKPNRTQERRQLLEKAVGERFSYEEMSKRSLVGQWNKLSPEERKEFVSLFQQLLASSYAGKVEGYSGEQVTYLNERLQGDYAEVRTKVITGKSEIPLDYRLMQIGDDWRVYDVVVDGVSLVSNYRGQFAKILRTSSYKDLLERLRKGPDEFKKPESNQSR
jgi:phospholipid transport system substrate-binding protein